ncbi:MAG: DUF4282 domain-containing protein [Sulfurimonas sp.]|uniref:DUF4282 domain-containing protein n=1 Tax=Sulfurimonas sp. TaxID=2022749 RepID=UPI0034564E18|nr:DUF4282 domain-containing protein [Sulfurimonas sp.]MCW9068132.1 DUF4282 domain-containing protein [Sulfurimonas sp.]
MQEIYDILSFKTFISSYILYALYYIGAAFVPFICFKYTNQIYKYPKNSIDKIIPKKYKFKVFVFFLSIFIFLEILWRMMFEFLIAYLQIRDSLVGS